MTDRVSKSFRQTSDQGNNGGKLAQISLFVDHLVDALGGDPSCTLRRAVVLADIDQYPGTTQTAIMDRLGIHKSALNRDIEWLYDHGCLIRQSANGDARQIELRICGYSKKNLETALKFFGGSHEDLKNFINGFITLFGDHKPTLRDAKIVAALGEKGAVSRQELLASLYFGPSTTDNRAINNLIDNGLIGSDEQ